MVVTRAIDAGFQSVIFTDIRTPQDVRDSIRLVRAETPDAGGLHGINSRRHSGGYGGAKGGKSTEDWVKEMNDVVIVVMIEKKAPWKIWRKFYLSKASIWSSSAPATTPSASANRDR